MAESATRPSEDVVVKVGSMSLTVPGTWRVKDAENGKFMYPDFGGLVYAIAAVSGPEEDEVKNVLDFVGGMVDAGDIVIGEYKITSDSSGNIYRFDASGDFGTGPMTGKVDIALRGNETYAVIGMFPEECTANERYMLDGVLESAKYPATPDTSVEDSAHEPQSEGPTLSQRNARDAATNYLSIMSFSFAGLVEQLMYEGYSEDDAIYGASNCGADWDAQAQKAARQYLDIMPFSHSGLVDQLVHDGYTSEQAEAAVTAVGL